MAQCPGRTVRSQGSWEFAAVPPHRQLGFPTEEDLLDWLENQPPRPTPRRPGFVARSEVAWVAVGAVTAAVVRALYRRPRGGGWLAPARHAGPVAPGR